ncbi:glutathione S-transferase [Dendrothele bispora CBS 962.96]|uniref:glutathione transferase n=1 Tax=Dendrothele bispora (strain CBS 962.96) TaxID=1314807 RepID=A0A4S8L6I0_DENBC|nr:glutathione S-transferase [Dendrothele bispora CBS 962.96]
MVLKLYGNPISIATKRVAVVLHEKKIPSKSPKFWSSNLSDKFPTFYLSSTEHKRKPGELYDDDGFILYESRAIARYLEAKYPNQGPKLAPSPSDVKATALFEQAASVELSDFDPFASKAAYEAIINPVLFGMKKDQAAYDQAIATLSTKLDVYERILSKQKFLAGDEITLADLFHLSYGELLAAGGSDLLSSKGPNVARWWKDVSSRASWQAVKDSIPTSL